MRHPGRFARVRRTRCRRQGRIPSWRHEADDDDADHGGRCDAGNGHATPEELEGGFTRDGWALGAFADDTGEMITETYQRADAFLFGRRTYEMFAETWGTRPEMRSHPIGVALNQAQKYVASSTLERPSWGPVTLLSGDPIWAIRS